ncbi:MAG: glycosyltransferase family 39 protein [Vicinamibacterales bacterium]
MIDSAVTVSHRRPGVALSIGLGLLTLVALLLRTVAIAEPLGIDQSLWASAVRGMSRGQLLYRDVWEQRPPGIYWIYLNAFRLFGWTAATVAWLDVLAAATTTVLLYTIVRRLDSSVPALVATALYATLTMPAWLYGNGGFLERSICETFIIPLVAAAALCAVLFSERQSLAAALGIGLFAGAAVVMKPNAGLYFPALLLWTVFYTQHARQARSGFGIRALAVAIAGGAVVPLVALLWLWRSGILIDAKIAVIDFNRYYVGQGFSVVTYADLFSHAVFLRMKTDPLWLCGITGSLLATADLVRRRRLPPAPALALIWGGAAVLVIVVNGMFLFNSYFINAFPPLAIAGAWLLADAARETRARKLIAVAAGVLMVALLVQRDYAGRVIGWAAADLERLRGRDQQVYLERFGGYDNQRGYSARANAELAEYVRLHTLPEERVFLFGINGAGVYFAADRLTAHRFLRVNFFIETTFADPSFRLDAVVRDLAARRPRYIIFERLNSKSTMGRLADALPQGPELTNLLSNYTLDAGIEDFTLFRSND